MDAPLPDLCTLLQHDKVEFLDLLIPNAMTRVEKLTITLSTHMALLSLDLLAVSCRHFAITSVKLLMFQHGTKFINLEVVLKLKLEN